MVEPITTAMIVGLAAQKFAEGAAGKFAEGAAEKLVEKLWGAIATRFSGRKKIEENLAAIEITKGEDTGAIANVTAVLKGEFMEDEAFEASLKELVQQIVNIQSQTQSRQDNSIYGRAVMIVNHGSQTLNIGNF